MEKAFEGVPEDKGTNIINQEGVFIDSLPALHQKWSWEGIIAESVIFHANEVAEREDEMLFAMICSYFNISPDGKYTVKREADGFTFVNFNFVDFEDILIG